MSQVPGLDWDRIVRTAGAAQIAAAQSIRLRLEDDPALALVPLVLSAQPRDHHLRSEATSLSMQSGTLAAVDRHVATAWKHEPAQQGIAAKAALTRG